MSQADAGDGTSGTLGKKNLTTMHAVAQALAIGPMFSVALILGGVSRPDIGAGWNAALAVLLAGLGVVAIAYTISLYARKYAGAGAVYEYLTHGAHPWVGVFTAGFFFVGALFLGGGGIYLGLGILSDNFWKAHISRQRARLVDLGNDRARDRPRPQLLRRPARDPRDADVRGRLVRPDADPRARDHLQGRREREHADMFDPGQTSLFGITGGGVLGGILLGILLFVGFEAAASIGEESEDPHRSIPRALIGTVAVGGGVLRLHVLRLLDRLRQEGRQRGRLGVLAERRRRDGDEVRRSLVRDAARDRRHPRRDGARARDLRHDRPRLLRARP